MFIYSLYVNSIYLHCILKNRNKIELLYKKYYKLKAIIYGFYGLKALFLNYYCNSLYYNGAWTLNLKLIYNYLPFKSLSFMFTIIFSLLYHNKI